MTSNLKKTTRIHREGIFTLIVSIHIFIIINFLFYKTIKSKIPFYISVTISSIVYLLLVNFFRCPIRLFKGETRHTVVAPADGKIVVIEEVEENEYFQDKKLMISIFMNILNVHINWYPVEGTIKKVRHQKGKFMKAWLPKASTENERSLVIIKTPEGVEVMARQIAGAMARRIVTYAKEGENCYIDEQMGFIKLGSRVDVYLPIDCEPCVKLGDLTTGNKTIIAKLK